MADKTFYVTTPIYYPNADPHIGSSYTTVMCDILRRYYDLLGFETYFLTGTDEHGEKVFREAQDQKRDVREMVDDISERFRALWPQLNISNDDFIRTTEERHTRVVQAIVQKTYDSGDIYIAEYTGNYCVGCERFYTDTEVEATPGMCPTHEKPLETISEKNYFFRLSKYQDWLREKIESDEAFLRPEQYRREVLALLRKPIDDLCISRPAERLHWGIPMPFDEKYVIYVWYDALVNYISAIGYPDDPKFAKFWPSVMHVIGKDILRQHAVFWPCMLKAVGIEPFKRLRVHGYWTAYGRKISKSLGNAVDPREEIAKFGLDVFRYYLAREMAFGNDGDYDGARLVGRNNAELANDLGNLSSRLTAMIAKYCEGKMPTVGETTDEDRALLGEIDALLERLPTHLEKVAIHALLEETMRTIANVNRYVTAQAPWALMKKKETDRVATVLAVASQVLVGTAKLLWPVMPDKMTGLLAAFGVRGASAAAEFKNEPVAPGTAIQPAAALFPQLEWKGAAITKEAEAAPAAEKGPTVEPPKPEISFDDFMKVDLRVATVLEAERVPKTDKLMRLTIDVGFEQRQIVAGIAEAYAPEDLVGRQIVVVANLAPRKLKGIESKGMLLASRSGQDLFLLGPDAPSVPGSEVS
ncbi:methionine--tRNA ligase [Candidatus Sumerlaeota bacterium]|nr:methionine--tRNA ligase [Candidatus Sumerlaeota bacterium]